MTKETLDTLKRINKLSLDENEDGAVLSFFEALEKDEEALGTVDTEGLSVLVHLSEVSNLHNVLREDICEKNYTRDELQEHAPESYEGYWQVPRLVD